MELNLHYCVFYKLILLLIFATKPALALLHLLASPSASRLLLDQGKQLRWTESPCTCLRNSVLSSCQDDERHGSGQCQCCGLNVGEGEDSAVIVGWQLFSVYF
jgi:hypothetical protein